MADPPSRTPDVVLITVDTLRPDALGWIGEGKETPSIDALAEGGFRFPAAVAPAPLTLPSHASMLTGLLPRNHGVRDNGHILPPEVDSLAEHLQRAGYSTGAFVSGYPLKRHFGLDRGFDHYDDTMPTGRAVRVERTAIETVEAGLDWIRTAESPRFLWMHFYDPHLPYEPPRPFWSPGPRGAYDGEVAYVDHAVGELLAALPPSDRLTLLTSDHGEGLGEHGEPDHGFFVYDSTVLVPLIIHFPGRIDPGQSGQAARLVDLAPTILSLLDLPALEGTDGVDLRPLLEGRDVSLPPAYIEARTPWTHYGWSPLYAARTARWKLIRAPRPELYDLAADQAEAANLFAVERRRAAELRTFMRSIESTTAKVAGVDPRGREELSALGYVGTLADAAGEEPGPGLADPKDRLELRRLLQAAETLLRQGRPRRALEHFDRVLGSEPENVLALRRSGVVLAQTGDHDQAIERLEAAVRLRPEGVESRHALATALARLGDHAAAIEHWQHHARLQPRFAPAWYQLGVSLRRVGRCEEAIVAQRRAASLAPADPRPEREIALCRAGPTRRRENEGASARQ